MPKQKKNSPDDELYFDIVPPLPEEEKEESLEKNIHTIPIKKESFACRPRHKVKEEVEEEIEYIEEEVEEEPEEEPEVEPKPKKSKKKKNIFSIFKRKTPKVKVKVKGIKSAFSFKKKVLAITLIAIFVLSSTFALLTYAFNNVNINISTQKGSIEYTGDILIDANIKESNFENNVIPGRLIELNQKVSEEYNSTGKVNGGAKANGKITIYNAYNTSSQILVKNTRFESPDGLIFRINSRVIVPGATLKNGELVPSSIVADATADETGKAYNIAATRFTIPGFKGTDRFTGFYGESKAPFTGGSDGESTVVSNVDLKNAEKEASDVLFEKLKTELKNQIQSEEKTFQDSIIIKVDKIDFNGAEVGDSLTKFTVNIDGEIKTIVFSKKDYLDLIQNKLQKDLKGDEEFYGEYIENVINVKPDSNKNQVLVSVNIQYPTKKKLKANEIIENIKGKSVQQTQKILEDNPAIEKANIKLYPIWTRTIPDNNKKIRLGID